MPNEIDTLSVPKSPMQASRFLSQIREEEQRKEQEIPDETKEELKGLREVTRDTLNNPLHVLPELLQNADDIGGDCSKVSIELTEDALVFRNHQEPMAYENVEALGAFTKSTKQGDFDSIGYFGIGFKTIFSLTENPYIHSGCFSFRYESDAPTTPIEVEYGEQPATDEEWFDGTTIVLPFSEEARGDGRKKVEGQLETLGSLLPFLNNITRIDVDKYNQKTIYRRETTDQGVVQVVSKEDGEEIVIERLRLFSNSFSPEPDMLEKLAEKRHLDAEALQKRNPELDITIAVQVDEAGVPTMRRESSLGSDWPDESHLFCYFPTDADTRLPFDIQADFSLRPDRETIVWPDEFNKKLLNQVSDLFADAFVRFHQEEVSPSRILELIPDPKRERPSYLVPVVEKIVSYVRSESCVPDEDNNLFRLDEVVFLEQPFRSLFSEAEVGDVLEKKVRYPSEKISDTARERLRNIVDDSVVEVEDLLENSTDSSLYESRSNDWFVRFFAAINQYWRSKYQQTGLGRPNEEVRMARDAFRKGLKQVPLLPLDDSEVASYRTVEDEVYRLQRGYTDDYELFTDTDQLKLLSEEFLSTVDYPDERLQDIAKAAKSFLFDSKPFSIPTLEAKDVVRDVINPAFQSESIEPDLADQYILFVSKRAQTLADVTNIKLQVRGPGGSAGDFQSPESLYLGTKYIDAFDSETLFGPFENLAPISNHYLELGEKTRSEWADALAAIGVTRRVEVRKQDPWESDRFKSQEEAEEFLLQHDDRGETELHDERNLCGYNGQSSDSQWMKREQRHGRTRKYKYGFIDRCLPEESAEILENLTADGSDSADVNYWREFMNMLDAGWESYYQDKIHRVYRYSEYSVKYRVKEGECACPSSFGLFLRKSAWCPGSDDKVYQTNRLFVRNDQTKNKPVTFVDPQPEPQELIEFLDFQKYLGIQVSATALQETVEEYMEKIKEEDVTNNEIERAIRSDLWAISRELDDGSAALEADELEALDRLKQTPFLYVANAKPAFRTPSQVTWRGDSLGEDLVPVSEIYTDFERLLTSELNVSREPTLDDCFSFLNAVALTASSKADTGGGKRSDILTAWSRILDKAVYISEDFIDTSHDQLERARQALKSESKTLTAAHSLEEWNDVEYHTTDGTILANLPAELQRRVLHPERDNRYTSEKYSKRLERLTGTQPLETSLNIEILTDFNTEDRVGRLYPRYSQLFDAAFSYLEYRGADSDTQLLHELADNPVYEVDKLSCRYSLGDKHDAVTDTVNCLLTVDSEERIVLISAEEQAGFELVDALVQELGLEKTAREDLSALLKGSFGKLGSMLQAYIQDDGYEYQQFIHTVSDPEPGEEDEEPSGPTKEDSEENKPNKDSEPEGKRNDTNVTQETDTDRTPNSGNKMEGNGAAGSTNVESTFEDSNSSNKDNTIEASGSEDGIKSPSNVITGGLKDRKESNTNSGGGGSEQLKSGNEGEEFVLEQLRDAVKDRFREVGTLKPTSASSSNDKYTVQGQIEGDVLNVRVEDVSQQHVGYDIQLEGAKLVRNQSELLVKSIGEDEGTSVEVKSSKNDNRSFTLSTNEYITAVTESTDYVVVRVHNVLDKAKIDRVFYTLPEFYEKELDVVFYPNGIKVEYTVSS